MAQILLRNAFFSVLLCVSFSQNIYSEENVCVEENPCLCKLSNDSYIDISHTVSKDNPYLSVTTQDKLTYYYFPCKDVKVTPALLNLNVSNDLNSCMKGASLCLYNLTSLINLGTTQDLVFSFKTRSLVFTTKPNITSTITLICTPESDTSYFEPLKHQVDQHQLLLFSPHACLRTEHRGLSTGSTLLVLLSVGFGVYLLGGALILHFLRGARGKEMIPNLDFWTSLPGLVRDGIIFLLNGCNPMSLSTAETYDRI